MTDAPSTPATAAHVSVVGAALTTGVVLAGGRIGPPGYATTFTRWGGLFSPVGIWPEGDRWPGVLLAAFLCGLALLWAATVYDMRRRPWSARAVWLTGSAWLSPLVLGPPLLSNDVYSYVAQGAVAAAGNDPTRVSPYSLGWTSPLLQAVDPLWRGTVSPYGPLATLLERGTVEMAPGHPIFTVLAWRILALASVAVIAWLAVDLARLVHPQGAAAAPMVVLFTWANPLLQLHVVSASHLEGPMVALLLAAVRLAMIGTTAARCAAIATATAAAAIKAPAGAVIVVVAALVWLEGRQRGHRPFGLLAAMVGCGAATWVFLMVLARSGWDLLATITTPSVGRTPAAPGTVLANLLSPMQWAGLVSSSTLLTVGRAVAALVGLAVISRLVWTAGSRPLTETVGWVLFVAAAASPVLYPWYLVWSVPLLIVTARGRNIGRLALVSALGAVMSVQGLTRGETVALATGVVLTALIWLGWHEDVLLRVARYVRVMRAVPERVS